jgi:hypothetical protein
MESTPLVGRIAHDQLENILPLVGMRKKRKAGSSEQRKNETSKDRLGLQSNPLGVVQAMLAQTQKMKPWQSTLTIQLLLLATNTSDDVIMNCRPGLISAPKASYRWVCKKGSE